MSILAKPVNQIPTIEEKDAKKFVQHFNNSKVSPEFLESCKKAGKLFRTRK